MKVMTIKCNEETKNRILEMLEELDANDELGPCTVTVKEEDES